MGVFKQREIRAFQGFQPEPPTNSVTTQILPALTHTNGIFRRFNRFSQRPRTANSQHQGGW